MQEALLQFIWKNSLFEKRMYTSDTAESVNIIEPGTHNHDGGPDFINARIEIGGTLWAGNIEIHNCAAEWYEHKHHTNAAYNNVVLHVVTRADKECFNSAGRQIPCIEIKYNPDIEQRYLQLMNSINTIPCHEKLTNLDPMLISFWLSALAVERLQSKVATITEYMNSTRNNWEETFYILIAYNFGLKINTLPFEMLAKSIPLSIVSKHTNNLQELEALFFGQAGFLNGNSADNYQHELCKEYSYLSKKYHLRPIENHLWKFLRLRPKNFPTTRIAQFCSLLHRWQKPFSKAMESRSTEDLVNLLNTSVSNYWKDHYNFGKISTPTNKEIGRATIYSIIINTVVPFLFLYGNSKNSPGIKERAVQFLEQIPAENNHITRQWARYNIHPGNAAESQALIQLTSNYCCKKRCLDCQIGRLILNH